MNALQLPTEQPTAYHFRIEQEFEAGRITRAMRDVALAIETLISAGRVVLTAREIAAEAVCSERTVRRARAALESCELLTVEAGFQLFHGRWQQGGNEYRLPLPGEDQ